MNQTTEKPKKEKKRSSVLEITNMFQELLDDLEQRQENGEEVLAELGHASNVCKDWLKSNRFYTDMNLGMFRYQKRIKRRASRKPLTINRLRGLIDEINQLAKNP